MALSAFVAPIQQGKMAQWREFIREIGEGGRWHQAYIDSRQKVGVRERAFLQPSPMGDLVIVTLEGEDSARAMARIVSANDEFMTWFIKQVQEIHGFDLRQLASQPVPELAVDSGAVLAST